MSDCSQWGFVKALLVSALRGVDSPSLPRSEDAHQKSQPGVGRGGSCRAGKAMSSE